MLRIIADFSNGNTLVSSTWNILYIRICLRIQNKGTFPLLYLKLCKIFGFLRNVTTVVNSANFKRPISFTALDCH